MDVQVSDQVLMKKLIDQAIRIVQLELTVEALREQGAEMQEESVLDAKDRYTEPEKEQ